MLFKKIGLALTFSPTSIALLAEVNRLQRLFDSEIVLIHAGEQNSESEQKMKRIITESGLDPNCYTLHWKKGEPVKVILNACEEKKVDLLVSGALEKENFLKYYLGSVARTLVRECSCPILLIPHPSTLPEPFRKISVSFDYSELSEKVLKMAYKLAVKESASELTVIREFQLPGLVISSSEIGSSTNISLQKQQLMEEERTKLELFIKDLNFGDININQVFLYGKQGWELSNYINQHKGDLLIIAEPKSKSHIFDRFFEDDLELIIKTLTCSTLVYRLTDYGDKI